MLYARQNLISAYWVISQFAVNYFAANMATGMFFRKTLL